jgi:hypothetical protein
MMSDVDHRPDDVSETQAAEATAKLTWASVIVQAPNAMSGMSIITYSYHPSFPSTTSSSPIRAPQSPLHQTFRPGSSLHHHSSPAPTRQQLLLPVLGSETVRSITRRKRDVNGSGSGEGTEFRGCRIGRCGIEYASFAGMLSD